MKKTGESDGQYKDAERGPLALLPPPTEDDAVDVLTDFLLVCSPPLSCKVEVI